MAVDSAFVCFNHTDALATYRCDWCQNRFCHACVTLKDIGSSKVAMCACGGGCAEVRGSMAVSDPSASLNRGRRLAESRVLEVLAYPLAGNGPYLIIGGAFFFWVLAFLSFIPLLGILAAIFGTGYLCAMIKKIIATSADAEPEMPNWPDFTSFWDDILRPMLEIGGTIGFCLAPAIAYLIMAKTSITSPVVIGLFGLGLFYLPAALLSVTMQDSLAGLNPILLVPSIIRIFWGYLPVVLALGLLTVLRALSESVDVGLLGVLIVNVVSFYLLTVQCRLLGLTYYWNRDALDWF